MSNPLVTYFIMGALGILLQVFAIKIPSLKAKYAAGNKIFTFKQYLADDWPTISASFVAVTILVLGLDEVLDLRPELEKYVKWLFVFVGYTGSSIIQAILSKANKKIMTVIDGKTNELDQIKGTGAPIN